jgi:CDP-diacylglycerol pyrophosphatase
LNFVTRRILFREIVTVLHLVVLALFLATPSFGADKRDTLWNIVSTCMDIVATNYCTSCVAPRAEAGCYRPCQNTTQVWTESRQFVVIRDRKMCNCPEGFVHGLALPRKLVTGVEDSGRPEGIWEYAWATAARRMPESEIALAVNPKRQRSQDQLHVHLVRVNRESLPYDPRKTVRVDDLGSVWKVAAGKAAELAWQDYGVLVVKGPVAGYLVVVDEGSTEYKFTLADCR